MQKSKQETEKNLNQISFYEGYIKGLKFGKSLLASQREEMRKSKQHKIIIKMVDGEERQYCEECRQFID